MDAVGCYLISFANITKNAFASCLNLQHSSTYFDEVQDSLGQKHNIILGIILFSNNQNYLKLGIANLDWFVNKVRDLLETEYQMSLAFNATR
jgi:hypothetical protein